jgi:hypothetical protein
VYSHGIPVSEIRECFLLEVECYVDSNTLTLLNRKVSSWSWNTDNTITLVDPQLPEVFFVMIFSKYISRILIRLQHTFLIFKK